MGTFFRRQHGKDDGDSWKKVEKPSDSERTSRVCYDVHPGVAKMQKWISELKETTGRTVDDWVALTQKEGPD